MNRTKPFALLAALLALALVCVSCSDDSDSTADGSQESSNTSLSLRSVIALPKADSVQLIWSSPSGTKSYGGVRISWGSGAVDVAKGTNTYTVTGLSLGTKYTFNVIPLDSSMSAAGSAKTVSVTTTASVSGGSTSGGVSTESSASVAGEPLSISLEARPNNAVDGKTNTSVTVTATITTASAVKKAVYKKDGTRVAADLLADTGAALLTVDENDNLKWTFTLTATDESLNGTTYTVAAIDVAGREETGQITLGDIFDFTAPASVTNLSSTYDSAAATITLTWTDPGNEDFDHVLVSYTTSDGTTSSAESEAVTVAKGTQAYTLSDVDSTVQYYRFTIKSVDELGNTSGGVSKRCWLNSTKVNAQIGDIVLSDGSLVTQSEYTSSLEAVAVVFREYDDVNDLPALAVGLVEGTDLAWAPSGTTGYTTNFTGIQGTVSSSTYTYGTTTYSGDDDGSDNWAYIQSVDASGTANAETYYPVFNWVNNYDTNAGISTTIDWYLPSFAELVLLKENISAINESITTAGGTAFATGLWYWSSTQDSADRGNALELNILQDGQQCIIQKTFSSDMRIRAIMKLE